MPELYDAKPAIVKALAANANLTALLAADKNGKPAISQVLSANSDLFPRVNLFELDNTDEAFYDNAPNAGEIYIQVDIWSKLHRPVAAIAKEINNTFFEMGYTRYSSADLFEDDTLIHHKGLRYSATKFY